jgi:hypothetical protein
VGKKLRAKVSGGLHPKNEVPVLITRGDSGDMVIQQQWRKELMALQPEWVGVRTPSATRDNGRLVVIRGDHCGKYVRRVHHYYVDGNRQQPIMRLVVTVVVDHTGAEEVTLEHIDLPPDDLCQGFETDEEKRLNEHFMKEIRDQFRYPVT